MKKVVLLVFVLFLLSTAVVLRFVTTRVIAQMDSTTTVYLDPPTINGTVIGQEFNVSILIRDAYQIFSWQVGLTFNPDLLEFTGFFWGEFLPSAAGPPGTYNITGTINNTAGMIFPPYSCILLGEVPGATGDGRLAYATFRVKATGISDIHLSDIKVLDYELREVHINIIDVYTAIVDTTSHTIVTVSNSIGTIAEPPGSGFYGHVFSIPAEKLSFKVRGQNSGFSNVTIPKTLLSVDTDLGNWTVKVDGKLLTTEERIITENATHYSIYFTYSAGFHYVQITTRELISSTISIAISSTNVTLGSDITISGDINPVRPEITVTILYRWEISVSGKVWFHDWNTFATFAIITSDSNSHYTYTRTLEKAGTYEFMAMWEGDDNTFGDVSDVQTLTVLPIYVFEVPWDDKVFHVVMESNSTVSNFNFNQSLAQISFNVTGQDTTGFCNITIPKTLMWVDALDEWNVTIDCTPLSTQEKIVTSNGTHYFIYFTCNTSTVTIQVISKYVIPEFPTWTSMLLILILLTVAITITKRRLLKTPIS